MLSGLEFRSKFCYCQSFNMLLLMLLQRIDELELEDESARDHLATGIDESDGDASHAYSATPPGRKAFGWHGFSG